MKGLGKDFNAIPLASGIHFNLKDAAGITFLIYENGGDTQIVFKESKAGASEAVFAVVNELYASNGIGGVWSRETTHDDAGVVTMSDESTVQKRDTTPFDCASIYIGASELSDTFDSVECTVDGSATLTAIVHGLLVQRDPENLPASGV